MGLRPRLALLLLFPMLVTLGTYAYLSVEEQRAERLAEFSRHTAVTSTAIRLAVEHALRQQSMVDAQQLMGALVVQHTEIVRIRLLDASLRVVLDSNLLTGDVGAPHEQLRRVIEGGAPDHVDRRWDGRRLYADLLPLRPRRATVEGVLEVVYVAAQLDQDLLRIAYDHGLRLGLVSVILVVLTAFVLQRFVLRPLAALMGGIQRLGQGEPGPPVPVARGDELGRAAKAFNEMSARLHAADRELLAESERALDLQRQLRRTEALGMLGKLCSSVAHEVGTPLNVIAGRAELVLQGLPSDSPVRGDLQAVLAQTDRISKIIRSLLDPLRPQKPALSPTTLGTVVDGLVPLLRHTAKRRGVALGLSMSPRLPRFDADPGQLQQVLINLVMNALEATPRGGRVALEARPLSRDGQPGIGITVTDTGPGIPAEVWPRLFEPFFTTKSAGEGTGLGLAIAQDIVREHGGEIGVESTVGVGTAFTVWLPEAKRSQP